MLKPTGTNSGRFKLEEPEEVDPDSTSIETPDSDPLDAERTRIFFQWLHAREEDGYEGNLDEFTESLDQDFDALFPQDDDIYDGSQPLEQVQRRAPDEIFVAATLDHASALSPYHVGLESGDQRVLSPECLLSALDACGVDNARIEIEGGEELPVVDGSAVGWVLDIRAAGVRPADGAGEGQSPALPHSPVDSLCLHEGDAFISFVPGPTLRFTAGVEFQAPVIGRQWHSWSPETDPPFRHEIAPARRHLESLEAAKQLIDEGLMLGGADRWQGPVGIKADGGGCTRGRGLVGSMVLHRAAHSRDKEAIVAAVDGGADVNEVEAAGNTPLHSAAYEGWLEGCELLLGLGAKIDASNNAGDRPWHWARNMGHQDVMDFLEQNGASTEQGQVLVQDHVPKVKDFFQRECWAHHPKPHAEYMEWRKQQDAAYEAERAKLIPGM
ncbi:hypothetical protein QBZ16_003009 [Prototheca wickerhamii]|uniref:UDP-3-O-acyl-N-acetylglucosamine deacetylase n=1 Tax=Prototheca wickerhamii TaxID=3111 RepID=A0AAD9IKP3_PROWI|nr:hypothetical protein QBZ16_003009 [Prototheca wickerhamii]